MTEFGRVTTRVGDGGETSLFGGERASKDDILFESVGVESELFHCRSQLGVYCLCCLAEGSQGFC